MTCRIPLIFFFLIAVPIICSSAIASEYEQVRSLIANGDLTQAREELNGILQNRHLDWEGACLQGLLGTEGTVVISALQQAVKLCDADCDEPLGKLISALYADGRYEEAAGVYESSRGRLSEQKTAFTAPWFAALAYLAMDSPQQAMGVLNQIEKPGGWQADWRSILQAEILRRRHKKSDAVKRLNDIIAAKSEASAAALYLRTCNYAQDGDMDRALSGFSMLKESYPEFLGSGDLLKLLEADNSRKPDGSVESAVDVHYTIHLGTYSEKSAAKAVADRLKTEGWTCREESRLIDGRRYYILTTGSFSTIEAAQKTRKLLEEKVGGSYKVILIE